MESVINLFHIFYWNCSITLSVFAECPKGMFGVFVLLFTGVIFRVGFRASSFYNMLLILIATVGVLLSDLITLVGVIDIVFGEVDK